VIILSGPKEGRAGDLKIRRVATLISSTDTVYASRAVRQVGSWAAFRDGKLAGRTGEHNKMDAAIEAAAAMRRTECPYFFKLWLGSAVDKGGDVGS
jgi:hypothetical protein